MAIPTKAEMYAALCERHGADVQAKFGFNTPQAIFKWMRGDAVPTIDNLVILADILDMPIDKIIIVTRI